MGKLDALIAKRRTEAEQAPASVETAMSARLGASSPFDRIASARAVSPAALALGGASKIDALIVDTAKRNNPHAWRDIERIIKLPIVHGYPEEARERFRRENQVVEYVEREGFRLHDVQCDALLTFLEHGQVFCPIGVGFGKTLITLMIAAKAFKSGVQKSALFVPPQVVTQLWTVDIPWAKQRVALHGCPFHLVTGTAARRRAIIQSNRRGCYIIPWSMMSTVDAEEMLWSLSPELIIGDEAHNLRNHSAARTKRLERYFNPDKKTTRPAPRVVWLSGTITSKSLMDYHHLVLPLGDNCPLPLEHNLASEWAAVLDADAEPDQRNVGPIKPLIQWAISQPEAPDCPFNGTGFRRAFRHRMTTNPCVVATGDAEIGVSLGLRLSSVETNVEGYERLSKLMKNVDTRFQTPSGDEIEHAMHTFKWLYELSAGFYNDHYWPTPETVAKRKSISEAEAAALIELAKERHGYLQEYHKCLRRWLKDHHIEGLDTPMLVGRSLAIYGASQVKNPEMYGWWLKAKVIEKNNPGIPERDSRYVRVCPYKVNAAVEWAQHFGEGIIWFYHNALGEWLHELLPDALFCPAGTAHNGTIIKSKKQLVIASIKAHGTGKNLQFHRNMLYTQFPRDAQTAEQSLGRIHRNGQEADELIVDVLLQQSPKGKPPTFDELVFAAMLNDACYVQQTTGGRQKVMFCTYEPTPTIIPGPVLLERGLDPKLLSRAAQSALLEKFSAK